MWGFEKLLLQILKLYFIIIFQIFTTKYSRIQKKQNIAEFKRITTYKICDSDFRNPHSFSLQSDRICNICHIVMKCCEVFCHIVMKCCEDSKTHHSKFWRSSILLYFIILWWNDMTISKISAENFEKVQFLFCDEMIKGFQKSLSKEIEKKIILMFYVALWWNAVRILKIIFWKS